MALFATAFSLRTPLSVEEAVARLRAAADPNDPRRDFNGDVAGDGFALSRINHNHPYGAAWARMRGRIVPDAAGAQVSGDHAPTGLVIGLSAAALAGLLLVAVRIVATNLGPGAPAKNLAIPIGLVVAALALVALSLWVGVRTDLAALARTAEAGD